MMIENICPVFNFHQAVSDDTTNGECLYETKTAIKYKMIIVIERCLEVDELNPFCRALKEALASKNIQVPMKIYFDLAELAGCHFILFQKPSLLLILAVS